MREERQFRLGELLLQAGAITRAQLSAALALQAQVGGRLGSNLIEIGAVDERTLAHVLAQQLNIASASAAQLESPAKAALALIPRELAEKHRAIPIRIDGQRLWVALADPSDREALQALELASALEVRPMVAPDVLIDFALGKHYGVRRRARVLEVRDAELLEVEPDQALAVYDPYASSNSVPQKEPALGFLDERKPQPAAKGPRQAPPPVPTERVPSALDVAALRAKLRSSTSDDAIFDHLLDALHPHTGRVALLLIRGGVLVAQRGRGIDARSLALVRLAIADAPTVTKLLEGGAPYFGPLPSQFGSLFQELGTPNGLCLPLTMGKRALGLLVGGHVAPALASQAAELVRVVAMVDLTLHMSHLRARLDRV